MDERRGGGPPRSSAPTDAVWVVPSSGPMWSSAPTERNGSLPRLPGQRLAKRKARKEELVKFSLCPTSELCSTGYRVRRSQPGPARALADITSTEQNSLAPRPAARQGALRARNCAAKSVFSFDGSTAVFFLALTQKKMGVESPPGLPGTPGWSTGPRRRGAPGVWLPPAKFRNGIWGVSHGHPALRKSVPTIPQSPYGRQLPFHKGAFDPVAVRAGGYSPPGWGCRSPGR